MATINIRGVPVSFPFKPYDIQKDYMEKVIECLQTESNGVLESPTGTGKTLSLLCSSLAWLTVQKAKFQAEGRMGANMFAASAESSTTPGVLNLTWDIPTIIYASRTHSQLTQAMQELKRTSYAHVRSSILGSRDQMCIHPDVSQQEGNALKTSMCQALCKSRNCYLQNRVEKCIVEKPMQELNIADIEDLVALGQKHKFCPFYMARELRKTADVIFMPYNYLLDPKARRANQLDLKNSVIILDEAHNVERVCEDSASIQLKSADLALCAEELNQVGKHLELTKDFGGDGEREFSDGDVACLKKMILDLEKEIDQISLPKNEEGITYGGEKIFEILKAAGIDNTSQMKVLTLLGSLIKFMTTNKDSPFERKGDGLQVLEDLLLIVFQKTSKEYQERVNQCFKVHVVAEVEKKKATTQTTWLSKATAKEKSVSRVLSYWCFSPSFGMKMLMEQGVRCVILTSGTLAPLKPLISELGINVPVRLENPHVVSEKQIYVKILGSGPDGTELNAGFQNRSNAQYISSLGMAIANISRQVPHGLLVFFPSYALLAKCQDSWQQTGIWNSMNELKQIFIEPKTKDAFNTVMTDFYERVKDPVYKGATFMAVCRGKVSEGLDFADLNGRAVIITGLPYPPFKDPRVVLKRKYLDSCRARDREYISGQAWYGLEATRAVNQAIGRVIRHQHDYGAILLLDSRFNNYAVKSQLSKWIREHVKLADNFGGIIRDIRDFFKNAEEFDVLRDQAKAKRLNSMNTQQKEKEESVFGSVKIHELKKENRLTEASTSNSVDLTNSDDNDNDDGKEKENEAMNINTSKRNRNATYQNTRKKMKLHKVEYNEEGEPTEPISNYSSNDIQMFIEMMKKNLEKEMFETFCQGLGAYKETNDINVFINYLNKIFRPKPQLRYLIQGLHPYIKDSHKAKFTEYWKSMR